MSASDCLYDTSVWVALTFSSHPHQKEAMRIFREADSDHPAVFCRATQQGYLRILTTPTIHRIYGSGIITNDVAWQTWEKFCSLPQIVWKDEPPGLEALWSQCARLPTASPKVWMDAYLAAFAMAGKFRMVTLDRDFRKFEPHGLDLQLIM